MEPAGDNHQSVLDRTSFEVLFRTYYSGLTRYAMKYLEDPLQADEIVQEVFYQLWAKRHQLVIRSSHKAYLFKSVHNHCLNVYKHRKVREGYRQYVTEHYQDHYIDAGDRMEAMDLQEKILEGIAMLPKECARVFRMNRMEGFKYREIAEKLGISQKTVEAQMSKAMKRLRVHLKAYLSILLLTCIDFFDKL